MVPCNYYQWIVEYAAGDYSGKTLRRIETDGCPATGIAIDAKGFIYTSLPMGADPGQPPTISKWPANASGHVTPLTTFAVPSKILGLASDASGNLFALEQNPSNTTSGTLVKFAAGSTTPQTVLPGVTVAGFTMDASGNIYAEVPTSASAFQIEEFAPGSTTPSSTLTSSSLTTPLGIAIVP